MKLKYLRQYIKHSPFLRMLIAVALRLIFFLWNFSLKPIHHDYPQEKWQHPVIYLTFHENILPAVFIMKEEMKIHNRLVYALSSQHPDTELFVALYNHYEIKTIYGSSTHGGIAVIRQAIAMISQNASIVISPDGPQGPAYKVKKGALYIAMKTGVPLVPFTIAVEKQIRLKTWDRMKFLKIRWHNQIHVFWGNPIWVSMNSHSAMLEKICAEVEVELLACTDRSELYFVPKSTSSIIH